jgi:hypothetical protein
LIVVPATWAIDKNFSFTADYQLITNPAYNATVAGLDLPGRPRSEF